MLSHSAILLRGLLLLLGLGLLGNNDASIVAECGCTSRSRAVLLRQNCWGLLLLLATDDEEALGSMLLRLLLGLLHLLSWRSLMETEIAFTCKLLLMMLLLSQEELIEVHLLRIVSSSNTSHGATLIQVLHQLLLRLLRRHSLHIEGDLGLLLGLLLLLLETWWLLWMHRLPTSWLLLHLRWHPDDWLLLILACEWTTCSLEHGRITTKLRVTVRWHPIHRES